MSMTPQEADAFVAAMQTRAQVDDVLIVNWIAPPADGDYRTALAELVSCCLAEAECFEVDRLKKREAQLVEACNLELAKRRKAETDLHLALLDVQHWQKRYLDEVEQNTLSSVYGNDVGVDW